MRESSTRNHRGPWEYRWAENLRYVPAAWWRVASLFSLIISFSGNGCVCWLAHTGCSNLLVASGAPKGKAPKVSNDSERMQAIIDAPWGKVKASSLLPGTVYDVTVSFEIIPITRWMIHAPFIRLALAGLRLAVWGVVSREKVERLQFY